MRVALLQPWAVTCGASWLVVDVLMGRYLIGGEDLIPKTSRRGLPAGLEIETRHIESGLDRTLIKIGECCLVIFGGERMVE